MNVDIFHPKEIYPLTIVCDRYSGTYSGGRYLALNTYSENMPLEIGGGDTEEGDFFSENGKHTQYKIGKGNTPNEAYEDLYNKINPQA